MNIEEAIEWLKGNRCTVNNIPIEPRETWEIRVAQTDASMMQQAYWIVKAHKEKLLEEGGGK